MFWLLRMEGLVGPHEGAVVVYNRHNNSNQNIPNNNNIMAISKNENYARERWIEINCLHIHDTNIDNRIDMRKKKHTREQN